MDNRSAIERLVDAATGYDPTAPRPEPVILVCPGCGATKNTTTHEAWPKDAVRVVAPCPKCKVGDISFFDKDGKELKL